MRATLTLLLGVILMQAAFTGGALAQTPPPAGPVYTATYIEVAASSAKDAAKTLTAYRDASRKEDGNLGAELAQETSRPNRFVVLEMWKDQAALDAHGKSAAAGAMRDKLKPVQNAPFDQRVHNSLNVGSGNASKKGAVIVVSHVDVIPPKKDEAVATLGPLADANRKAAGNQRYDVLQQTSRPNHFTVVEAWSGKKAYDAVRASDLSRQFREKLSTMAGALYDERLFGLVK
jgi:quinol monooxygenase YgiN